MTVKGLSQPAAPTLPAPSGRAVRTSFADTLHSEWVKLRTVRSTYWSLLAAALLIVGIGMLFAVVYRGQYHSLSASSKATFDPTEITLSGVWFGQLAIGVLAILTITGEYSTGTIRPSLAAVPHRSRMLAAKILVFTAVTVVIGAAASFAAFFAGQPILAGRAPHAVLGDPGVLRAVIGGGLYLGALGIFSLAIGVLIRHTAGAITVLVAIALVIPTVMDTLPSSVQHTILRVLPTNAGTMVWNVRHVPDMFSAWPGFAVFLGYCAVLLAWGFAVFTRRDT
ncbi:MAG TPA: ABC transporter permease subunit [Streptosporangiaceae bacterium]